MARPKPRRLSRQTRQKFREGSKQAAPEPEAPAPAKKAPAKKAADGDG